MDTNGGGKIKKGTIEKYDGIASKGEEGGKGGKKGLKTKSPPRMVQRGLFFKCLCFSPSSPTDGLPS